LISPKLHDGGIFDNQGIYKIVTLVSINVISSLCSDPSPEKKCRSYNPVPILVNVQIQPCILEHFGIIVAHTANKEAEIQRIVNLVRIKINFDKIVLYAFSDDDIAKISKTKTGLCGLKGALLTKSAGKQKH